MNKLTNPINRFTVIATFCCVVLILVSTFSLSQEVHAKTHPKVLPPAQCLTILLAVYNVHIVPLPKGTGEAYTINMTIINNCKAPTDNDGGWSLVAKLTCLGQTSLGFSLSGPFGPLQIQYAQNVVNQSRTAYCNDYENGVLVRQFPPDQETYYGNATATAGGVNVAGQATAYLYTGAVFHSMVSMNVVKRR